MIKQLKLTFIALLLVTISFSSNALLIEFPTPAKVEEVSYSDNNNLDAYLVKPKHFREGATYSAIIWLGSREILPEDFKQRETGNDQSGAFWQSNIVTVYPKNASSVEDIAKAVDYLLKQEYVLPERIFIAGHQKGAKLALESAVKIEQFNSVFILGLEASFSEIQQITSDVYFFAGEFGYSKTLNELKTKFAEKENFKFYEVLKAGKYEYLSGVLGIISSTLRKKKLPVKLEHDYVENDFLNFIQNIGFGMKHYFTTNNRDYYENPDLSVKASKQAFAEIVFFSSEKKVWKVI